MVRSRDERMSKDLLWIGGLVLILIGLFISYGWPRAVLRDTDSTVGKLQREQDKLLEHNRELRLEKAALQDLRRVELIARQSLRLKSPAPANVIVVERPQNLPPDARVAEKTEPGKARQ